MTRVSHATNVANPVTTGKGLVINQGLIHNKGLNTQGSVAIVPVSGTAVLVTPLDTTPTAVNGTDITLSDHAVITMPAEGTGTTTQHWVKVRQTVNIATGALAAIATTVATASNGASVASYTGAGVLTVASTAGFATAGTLTVITSGLTAVIGYTGISTTTFTGCTTHSGTGTLGTGGGVTFKGGPYRAVFPGVTWNTPTGQAPAMSQRAGAVDYYEFRRPSAGSAWVATPYQNVDSTGNNSQDYVWQLPTSGAAITLPDPATSRGSEIVLDANCVITMPTGKTGLTCWVTIYQQATGGPFTVLFDNPGSPVTPVYWPNGQPPPPIAGTGEQYNFWWSAEQQRWWGNPSVGGGTGGVAVGAYDIAAAFFMIGQCQLNTPSGSSTTVPEGATWMTVTAIGAAGGGTFGGPGSYVEATIPVIEGQVVSSYYNAAGTGYGEGSAGGGSQAAGGFASDVRVGGVTLSDRVLVAGGGGGQGDAANSAYGGGGAGGGLTGVAGTGEYGSSGQGGSGASQAGGGAGGSWQGGGDSGANGGAGVGGDGGTGGNVGTGGGGDGYYGGGGGGAGGLTGPSGEVDGIWIGAGGGGGSDYVVSTALNVVDIPGYNAGNGSVTPPNAIAFSSSIPYTLFWTGPVTPGAAYGTSSFTVPVGVTSMNCICVAAQGGDSGAGSFSYTPPIANTGGAGSYISATIPVMAGEEIYVNTGAIGARYAGGYGSYGGGAADIRIGSNALSSRVLVAGGGGGGGASPGDGGAGGGLVAQAGSTGGGGTGGGGGGTQSAGGAGNGGGSSGTFGFGAGAGWQGGGGDGWYGGGSGNDVIGGGGGGGGGSDYWEPTALNVTDIPGYNRLGGTYLGQSYVHIVLNTGTASSYVWNGPATNSSVTVPAGMTSMSCICIGAAGGGSFGGAGSYISATIPVTAEEVIYVNAGTVGAHYNNGAYYGGGASDIRIGGSVLTNRKLVAAGGGGTGNQAQTELGYGGIGGGLTGAAASGTNGYPFPGYNGDPTGGTGGTQSAGGTGGTVTSGTWGGSDGANGAAGVGGTGGVGNEADDHYAGGCGGNGWYGGGGGAATSGNDIATPIGGGGGGGSDYLDITATFISDLPGYNSISSSYAGNGYVSITFS